jgi:hypothetical protein
MMGYKMRKRDTPRVIVTNIFILHFFLLLEKSLGLAKFGFWERVKTLPSRERKGEKEKESRARRFVFFPFIFGWRNLQKESLFF